MTDHFRIYLKLIDALRTRRSGPDWKSEDDRGDLATLEDLFERLSEDEQRVADAEGWRSWPDLYDQHMEQNLVEPTTLGLADESPARRAA